MTLLRVLVVALGVGCLLAVGAWLVVDARATNILRTELAGRGLRQVLTVEEAGLLAVGTLEARGLALFDPLTGAEVGRVERLAADAGLGESWFTARLESLRGEGGRAVFERDADGLPFVRAMTALLHAVPHHDAQPHAPHRPVAIDFRDLEATLRAPGQPGMVLPGCSVHVTIDPQGTRVDISLGPAGGLVALTFGNGGLHRVQVTGAAVEPVAALFLPQAAQSLAADLQPRGVLDLDLSLVPGDPHAARAEGRLRDAGLSPDRLPFALERGSVPFLLEDGHVTVDGAHLDFPGGQVQADLEADPHGFTLDVDTQDAAFLGDYLKLLPHAEALDWLVPEDGGRLDLALRVRHEAGGRTDVEGWGGVFVERLRVGPSGVLVEDVVGSLDVRRDLLTFHEVSGRCAGGAAKLAGSFDLRTGDGVVDGAVFDVDIARLDRALEMAGSAERNVAGWLQGAVHWEGRLGEPRRTRGSGQLSVRGGYLWRVPVLDAVLRALTLAPPAEKRADSLAARFRMRGSTWYVDEARLDSEMLTLRAEGRITRGGELDLKITPVPVGGLLGDVLRYLQRQLIALDLRGTWDAPQVRVLPLKAVTGPLGDAVRWVGGLFGGDEKPPADPEEDGTEADAEPEG